MREMTEDTTIHEDLATSRRYGKGARPSIISSSLSLALKQVGVFRPPPSRL